MRWTTIALAILMTGAAWAQIDPPGQHRPGKPGEDLKDSPVPVQRNLDTALINGEANRAPILLGVSVGGGEKDTPPAFSSPDIKKEQSANILIAAVAYDEKHPLFTFYGIGKESMPVILVLDPDGNIHQSLPVNTAFKDLLAAADKASKEHASMVQQVLRALGDAQQAHRKGDKPSAIKHVVSIASRHFRKMPRLDEAVGLLKELGDAALKDAGEDPKALDQVAKDFAKTVIEAKAILAKARLLKAKDKLGARKLLKRIVDEFPWGDCQDVVAGAKGLLEETQ